MKKLIKISILIFLVFLSMGNLSVEVNVQMDKDGVEEYNVEIIVPNELLNETEADGFEIFVFDSPEEEFNDRISSLDYDNKSIKTYKRENNTVYEMTLKNVQVNQTAVENNDISPAINHTRRDNGIIRFEQSMGAVTREGDFVALSNLESYYGYDFEATYRVNTTNRIVRTNGKMTGNSSVMWNLNTSSAPGTLYVETEGPERRDGTLIAFILLLTIMGVLVLIGYFYKERYREN